VLPSAENNWGQIRSGTTVFDQTGAKIGTVDVVDQQSKYLVVCKGLIFHKDVYVPMATIESVAEDGVFLSVTKQTLDDDRFSVPPASLADDSGLRNGSGNTKLP
jgi:hypothetical protein